MDEKREAVLLTTPPPLLASPCRVGLFWVLLGFFGLAARAVPPAQTTVSQFQMGMMVHLTVSSGDVRGAREACRTAFLRILELNRVFSDYEPESELSRLCRRAGEGPVPVSAELFTVLDTAQAVAEASGGRFDVTAAPVIRLWRDARKAGRPPAPESLAVAQALVGWTNLVLRAEGRTAELRRPGMRLDLGAIAKGYIADQALAHLRQHGFPSARVEAGGEVVCGDAPGGAAGWEVDTGHPEPGKLVVANQAVSMSGDASQHLDAGGVRHSHVVDARRGQALTNRVTCVVQAGSGLWSDPLSTLGSLLPEAEWRACLERLQPGAKGWRWVEGGAGP
jgi:FAD:protein FMN transferase